MVREIPRNGVIWCIEIAPNDLSMLKCKFYKLMIFIDRITKWEVYID